MVGKSIKASHILAHYLQAALIQTHFIQIMLSSTFPIVLAQRGSCMHIQVRSIVDSMFVGIHLGIPGGLGTDSIMFIPLDDTLTYSYIDKYR